MDKKIFIFFLFVLYVGCDGSTVRFVYPVEKASEETVLVEFCCKYENLKPNTPFEVLSDGPMECKNLNIIKEELDSKLSDTEIQSARNRRVIRRVTDPYYLKKSTTTPKPIIDECEGDCGIKQLNEIEIEKLQKDLLNKLRRICNILKC